MTRAQRNARAVKKYALNILAVYLDADGATRAAGAQWYALEGDRCADFGRAHGLTRDAVAGAAAAISPGLRYETTFAYLAALIRDPAAKVPTYSREFCRRAVAILKGAAPLDVLGGPKVRAFYSLLACRDFDAVVIDGHALNIARGQYLVFRAREDYRAPAAARVTARRYANCAAAYRDVAELVGEAPHAVQATTWIHWRNITRPQGRQPGED